MEGNSKTAGQVRQYNDKVTVYFFFSEWTKYLLLKIHVYSHLTISHIETVHTWAQIHHSGLPVQMLIFLRWDYVLAVQVIG